MAERRKEELNGYIWHLIHAAPEVAEVRGWGTPGGGDGGAGERNLGGKGANAVGKASVCAPWVLGDVVTGTGPSLPRSATSSTPFSTHCRGMRRQLAPALHQNQQVGGLGCTPHPPPVSFPCPPHVPPVSLLLSRRHVGSSPGEGGRRGEALHLLQEQQALHHGDAHPGAGRCAASWGRVCLRGRAHGVPRAVPGSSPSRTATTPTPTSRPTCCPTPKKPPRGKPKWPEKPATPPTTRWYGGRG